MNRFWRGTLALLGTIIGVGVFGLPAMFQRVGFWPGTILFAMIAAVITAAHLLYVDVILSTPERMRLAGYAHRAFGKGGFWFAATVYPLHVIGIIIAYILVGGQFLQSLAGLVGLQDGVVFWQALFWVGGSLIVLYGIKAVARAESVVTWLLIAAMLLASFLLTGRIDMDVPFPDSWPSFFFPFGVFLLTLSGLPAIPEIVEITGRVRQRAQAAVTTGTVAAALISWTFGVIVYLSGASLLAQGRAPGFSMADPGTFGLLIPSAWAWLIPFIGLLAVLTSFFTVSQDLKETFLLDFRFSERHAWFLALFLPLGLRIVLQPTFLSVLDFVGTVFTALTAILIAAVALHLYKKRDEWGNPWRLLVPLVVMIGFFIGMVQKLFVV